MLLYFFQFCYICVVLHFVLLCAFLQCVKFNCVLKFKGFVGMKASRHNFPKASRFKYKYNTQKQHLILLFLFYLSSVPRLFVSLKAVLIIQILPHFEKLRN